MESNYVDSLTISSQKSTSQFCNGGEFLRPRASFVLPTVAVRTPICRTDTRTASDLRTLLSPVCSSSTQYIPERGCEHTPQLWGQLDRRWRLWIRLPPRFCHQHNQAPGLAFKLVRSFFQGETIGKR